MKRSLKDKLATKQTSYIVVSVLKISDSFAQETEKLGLSDSDFIRKMSVQTLRKLYDNVESNEEDWNLYSSLKAAIVEKKDIGHEYPDQSDGCFQEVRRF